MADRQKLYIMRNGIGLLKIGVAMDPEQRARTLACASGLDVSVVATYEADQFTARRLERQLHRMFESLRKQGEWFDEKLMDEVDENLVRRAVDSIVAGEHCRITRWKDLGVDIPSNPRFCLRLSPKDREELEAAAHKDGKALGTWLKWLGRLRIAELEKTGRTDN